MKASFLILILSAFPAIARIDQERLADAIWVSEGGTNSVSPYGILRRGKLTQDEGRRLCLQTIRHYYGYWHGTDRTFILHLADKYCPPSCDPVGNRRWKRNVCAIYFRK